MFIHGSTPPEACQQGWGLWGRVLRFFVFLSKYFCHRFTITFRKKRKKFVKTVMADVGLLF